VFGVTEINGIDVEKLREMIREVASNREAVRELNRWSARVRWLNSGFNFRAYVRNHSFLISEPSELGGPDTSPNAVEYVISALGACLLTGFVFNATKRGIRIRNAEISVDGELDNILVFLGVSNEGHPGYKTIYVKLYVDADADSKTLKDVWEETVRTSPVGNTLIRSVELKTDIKQIS
jgi:uncharacterized OsmC-like protein